MQRKLDLMVPSYVVEILNKDMAQFHLSKQNLCNRIYQYLGWDQGASISNSKHQVRLGFNLNKENQIYYEGLDHSKRPDSGILRAIFINYCSIPQHLREEMIFQELLRPINEGIEKQRCLRLLCYGKYCEVEPYLIAHAENESSKYIYSYCYKQERYVAYRLSNIVSAEVLKKPHIHHQENNLKEVAKNFTPFLGEKKRIIVKLSNGGLRYLEKFIHNRPKQISKNLEQNIFEFEATEFQARRHFGSFLNEVEILGSESLREQFKRAFEEGVQNKYYYLFMIFERMMIKDSLDLKTGR